jgi:hypothetical protein
VPNIVIDLVVFTPSGFSEQGRAMKTLIEQSAKAANYGVRVTTWDSGADFFDPANKYPLNECIRKLHSYDGAILILGPGAPRRTGNPLADAGDAFARAMRRLFGLPEAVNHNVLIEIGASMARFGRNRVFLVQPKSGSVDVPTYFENNNAIFLSYDDAAENPEEAVRKAAAEIVKRLKELGQSAYYSDLPSFGLAHGYLTNFVAPTLQDVAGGVPVTVGESIRSFSKAVYIIVYARTEVARRERANDLYARTGLAPASFQARNGRAISFRTLPDASSRDTLYVIDIPTNLVPSLDAIEKIENLWFDAAPARSEYRQRLEQREIANFFRYLDLLRQERKIDERTIRLLELESFDDLTLERIEAAAR